MSDTENNNINGVILDEEENTTTDTHDSDNAEVLEKQKASDKREKITDKIAEFKDNQGKAHKQQDISSDISTTNQNSTQNNNDELTSALLDFKNNNYTNAFNTFKKLAEEKDLEAIFMLGNMYNKGLGTAQDVDRAKYWLKNAADKGHKEAAFDYGMLLLNSSTRDGKDTLDGLYYLELSANEGYDEAAKKYIELVDLGLGSKKDIKQAVEYCKMLAAKATDSFDAKKYDDIAKNIKKKKAVKQTKTGTKTHITADDVGDVIFTIIGVVGEIGFLLPMYIIFALALVDYEKTNIFTTVFVGIYDKLILINIFKDKSVLIVVLPIISAGLITFAREYDPCTEVHDISKIVFRILLGILLLYVVFFSGIEKSDAMEFVGVILVLRVIGFVLGKILEKIRFEISLYFPI